MSEERKYLLRYRIEKAYTTLREAKLMAEKSLWNGALNRLYYSCFYAVIALLLTKDLSAKTHKGVRTLLHLHFVETNVISKEQSKFYSELFNARQKSDYEDFVNIQVDIIPVWIRQAENFINIIKEIIN